MARFFLPLIDPAEVVLGGIARTLVEFSTLPSPSWEQLCPLELEEKAPKKNSINRRPGHRGKLDDGGVLVGPFALGFRLGGAGGYAEKR
jgi:hypothetical protein